MFVILSDKRKKLIFIKVYYYSEDFSNRHVVEFFEKNVLKEIRILRYLHINSTMLKPKLIW